MNNSKENISHVSDTSFWVAYYRAKETDRPDALFKDPLAKILIGEKGKGIATHLKDISKYTEWTVVTRTPIIDNYIHSVIREGVDMVVNLGAGLDTRPYRLDLPQNLNWIEVDYPHIIAHKNTLLRDQTPKCQLTRVELDLADDHKRGEFLSQLDGKGKKIAIITEGVLPYLTEEQMGKLAHNFYNHSSIQFWMAEYFDPKVYRYLKASRRMKKMEKSPFRFYPSDWLGFFESRGWVPKEARYTGEESIKNGRGIPMPWFAYIFRFLASKKNLEATKRMTGHFLYKKKARS